MSKRNWIVGGFAILLLLIAVIYLFFPSGEITANDKEQEKKVNFLDVDSHWADSVLKTLSVPEKAAMIIMYQPNPNVKSDSIFLNEIPGAYILSAKNILAKSDSFENSRTLFFANFNEVPITDKIKFNAPPDEKNTILANQEIFFGITNDSIIAESKSLLKKAMNYYQLDGLLFPMIGNTNKMDDLDNIYSKDTSSYYSRINFYSNDLVSNNYLIGATKIDHLPNVSKVNPWQDSVYSSIKKICASDLPIFCTDSTLSLGKLKENQLTKFLKSEFEFNGLCISFVKSSDNISANNINNLLYAGSDILVTNNFYSLKQNIINLVNTGKIKESVLNAKVKKILLAKTWSLLKKKRLKYEKVKTFSAYDKSFSRRIRKAAFVLVKNDKNYLPIRNVTNNRMAVIHFGNYSNTFARQLYHYLPKEQTVPVKAFINVNEANTFNPSEFGKFHTVILTINGDISNNTSLIEKLNILSKSTKLILINFRNYRNLKSLANFSTLIQINDDTNIEFDFAAQSLMGAVSFEANLPFKLDKKLKLNKSLKLSQSRLQYTIPEDIGISSDSLGRIGGIMEEGIRNRAFPGAQVFFAIDGKVFYNKSFGTHTYTDRQEVKNSDLFDMASVTKVAASTIVAMSAYEKGLFKLNDSLHKHIPDTLKKHIRGKSTLRNITFKQILVHATGLAAGQPVLKYIRYRDSTFNKVDRFEKYYCDYVDDYYKIIVADKFYMEREQADTIWYAMNQMSVDENPSYRYSDANMNLLYKLLNPKIKNRWEHYLDSLFYKPLGMFNSTYLPIQNDIKPERIVPTENDRYWRKQLLRGYVHDPTAALFGGVAGNAGLFSTAEDIGILFQMLMYKGSYGGNQYFKKETADLFISQQAGSHRGLGFNRQVKGNTYGVSPYASTNTFGHTGFTGISVWADMDINLLYVSCTNRVHPDAENKKIINLGTTKRIHTVIYEQLKYIIPNKIDLEK